MSIGQFIGGVGAVIWRDDKYLILQRASTKDVGAGNWECVTGRVDQGEGFEQAILREVQEEIGVTIRLEMLIGTTHFYRGEAKPENELIGVFYGATLSDGAIPQIGEEHDQYLWMTAQEIYARFPNNWLSNLIRRAEVMRQYMPAELLALYHREGFEM